MQHSAAPAPQKARHKICAASEVADVLQAAADGGVPIKSVLSMENANYAAIRKKIAVRESMAGARIAPECIHDRMVESYYAPRLALFSQFRETAQLILPVNDYMRIDQLALPGAPSRYHVRQIIDFAGRHERDNPGEPMLIHCAHGMSRSTAALIIIEAAWRKSRADLCDPGACINEAVAARGDMPILPNPLMISHADALFDLRGALTGAVYEQFYSRSEFHRHEKMPNGRYFLYQMPLENKPVLALAG